MEQSFLGKLKRVKWKDLLHAFLFLAALLPAFFLKRKRPHIWLLCDTENEAGDNAWWLFQYLRREHPEVDAVFALGKTSKDRGKVEQLGPAVDYGSFTHWVYYLAAEKNISSQKMGKPNAAICYVLEVYGIRKNKRAFLQHGVIMSDLTFLHYPKTKMSLFVCSTQAEWEYVNRVYEYPVGTVKKLGLCRFDGLQAPQVKKNQVLVMPTWRMYIRNDISGNTQEERLAAFRGTDYYRAWKGLLTDPLFKKTLEDLDLEVIFVPHREMREFAQAFAVSSGRIRQVIWGEQDVQTLLKESAFLITDYSSVSLDFAYMRKPLAYYQFDYEAFRKNHIAEGYFSYQENGFGPVCLSAAEICGALSEASREGMHSPALYQKRSEEFFDLHDGHNCERNYEAIREM